MSKPRNPKSKTGRVEFVAEPEWVDRVAHYADAMGVNVSAYIRNAVNRQMLADSEVVNHQDSLKKPRKKSD